MSLVFGKKWSVSEKAGLVEDRIGDTTKGTTKKVKPKLTVRPSGNPLKGNFGVKAKLTF